MLYNVGHGLIHLDKFLLINETCTFQHTTGVNTLLYQKTFEHKNRIPDKSSWEQRAEGRERRCWRQKRSHERGKRMYTRPKRKQSS